MGRSLGVDIIPLKVCSFNCLYCQLGSTRKHTLTRGRFYDLEEIIRDLGDGIASSLEADYITFSGSGEPTLSSDLGSLIREVKKLTDIPVAVITNSSLLSEPQVREDLASCDLVVPSLDAAREETFKRINRPVRGLTLSTILCGLRAFTREFKGKVWLEVMLLAGINDSDEEIASFKDVIAGLGVDKVQLNTVARPPASSRAKPVAREKLEAIQSSLGEIAETEIVVAAALETKHAPRDVAAAARNLLQRRPCSEEELASTLGISVRQLRKELQEAISKELIEVKLFEDKIHYRASKRVENSNG